MSDFAYDSDGLRRVAAQVRAGGKALDDATGTDVRAPDAGESSATVAKVMEDMMKLGVAMAQAQDKTAEDIDVASGAYDDVENTNAGMAERTLDQADPRRGNWRDGDY